MKQKEDQEKAQPKASEEKYMQGNAEGEAVRTARPAAKNSAEKTPAAPRKEPKRAEEKETLVENAPVKKREESIASEKEGAKQRTAAPVKKAPAKRSEEDRRGAAKKAPAKKPVPVKAVAEEEEERPVRKTKPAPAKKPQPKRTTEELPRERAPKQKTSQQTYSNIPPKEVRQKREEEMKRGYDELLSVEDEDESRGSKAPVIILVILILIALGAAGTIFYCKMTDRPIPFISQNVQTEYAISASAEETEVLPEEAEEALFV